MRNGFDTTHLQSEQTNPDQIPRFRPRTFRRTRRIQVLSSAPVRKSTERRTWAGSSAMALRPVMTLTMSR